MSAILRAEGTKVWTLGATRWLLVGATVAQVLVGAAVAATLDGDRCAGGAACDVDPVRASLAGVWVAQIAVSALGVAAVGSEYDTSQIGVTLAAMPRRLLVLLAKTGVVAGLVVGTTAVGTVGSLVAGRLVLAAEGFTAASGAPLPDLGAASTVRAAAGTVLYLVLVAVLAVGVAAVLRDAATGLATTLAVLFLFPLLGAMVTDPTWQHRLQRYAPMEAGLAVQATRDLQDLAIGPWAGLAVLAAYSAAGLGVGAALFLRRDA
jgi:ABC-type transport system involved in multi-copper enzyme maturation permease subunit